MIRINLLPYRAARKKENIRKQVSIFCLFILLLMTSLAYYTWLLDKKIDRLNLQITNINHDIKRYKAKADKVTKIEKQLADLKKKIKVINTLESQRKAPMMLLDGMTTLIVKNRMWISSLSEKGRQLTLKGLAFDNKTVADFMTNLEKSPLFKRVDLKNLQMKKLKGDINMKSFEIICQKADIKPASKEQSRKKK